VPLRPLLLRGLAFVAVAGVILSGCDSSTKAVAPDAGAPSSIRYVAIGDSYSAGSLIPTTDVANGCFRSDHDYPSLVARALGAKLQDHTCSGATTSSFSASQYPDVPPQKKALGKRTTLVTVGLGGNDQQVFRTLIERCPALRASNPTGAPCRDEMRAGGKDVLLANLSATAKRLTTVLRQVRIRAPHAQVLAVGYPQIVDPAHVCAKLPLAAGDYAYAEQVNRALTDAVRRAAAATGTTYVDVWALSKGHDICSDDPWVNGAQDARNKAPRYHPFLAEHEAVAKLVASMVTRS
jgi:lysophospholipase L1-like esterase